jgi:hypothetical protein
MLPLKLTFKFLIKYFIILFLKLIINKNHIYLFKMKSKILYLVGKRKKKLQH